MRVAWFPAPSELSINPYWDLLHSSLQKCGVEFRAELSDTFGCHWLYAQRGHVQVVHFHYVQQFYAYETTHARLRWVARFARNLLLARALGFRTVFTLHNLRPTYPLMPTYADYLGHWLAANLTDAVIVHSESARQALAGHYGRRRKVQVIPHPSYIGVYPNTISRSEARARLGFSDKQTVFEFFGGIRPNKGIENLISAFAGTPGDDLRLLIAGKPWPPQSYLESLLTAATGDNRIRIVAQYIPDDEVQTYMNAADVVVLPFKEILTSGSAILAMSFRRPVIAPSMGCLPELLTPGTGLLYEASQPDALMRALACCRSVDLSAMGQLAYERASSFTWEEAGRQTAAVYAGVRQAV